MIRIPVIQSNNVYFKSTNPTHILSCEWEYKGGTPIIGIYDTTFQVITITPNINYVDGNEYKLIYIYKKEYADEEI